MLREEFTEILNFFSLDVNEKKKNFSEILSKSLQFSEKMQDKILHGTPEDREEVQVILEELKGKVNEETGKLCTQMGISEEDLASYVNNPNNYNAEDWQVVHDALQVTESREMAPALTNSRSKEKSKKRKATKANWIQS